MVTLEPNIEKCLLFYDNKDLKVAYKFWSQKLFFKVILIIKVLIDSKHNSGNTINICSECNKTLTFFTDFVQIL